MQFQYEKDGVIGRITMVNAPNGTMETPVFANAEELRSFFDEPHLKAVIIKGEGRHFCSGADPDGFDKQFQDKDLLQDRLAQAKELLDMIRFAPVPTVAAIRGSCLGGGLELALACHFRFAASSAMFGFPETGHRIMPGLGGTITAQQQISRAKLMELILRARMIGAEEALQIGLVDHVGSVKRVEEDCLKFLQSLTLQHSSQLIRTVMQSIHNGCRMKTKDALLEETRLFCELAVAARDESGV